MPDDTLRDAAASPAPGAAPTLDTLRRKSAGLAGLARNELVECLDGPARGQRRLEIDTPGGLSATLVVDRSLDILSLRHCGHNLGWRGASRARHPVPDPESDNGLGLMRSFDGLLVTCGLDHIGLPVERSADWLHYPPRSGTVHPLHGRLACAGVTLAGYGIDWQAGCAWATAEVFQTGVFTEALVLRRRIEIGLLVPTLSVHDEVVNDGFRPTPHQLLYHINIGYPLLDGDARLFGDNWDLGSLLDDGSALPSDDHHEIVDVAATPASASGFGVDNPALGLALGITVPDPSSLPITAVWRAYQSGVFALGIEPQTAGIDAASALLQAGERREYGFTLAVRPQA